MLGAQFFGDQAADQIDLILIGHGDHQIGGTDAGFDQYADAGAVTLHAQHIHGALRFAQRGGVGVHNDDIVILLGQRIGNGTAYLTVTDNDNFHMRPPAENVFLSASHILAQLCAK